MPTTIGEGNYAHVNGLNMYYEIHGTGRPLVLLHGGLGTIGMFDQLLPGLAETRQIIGVELQAHGHTADIDRPLCFEQMADDVAALIKHLGLETADVLGYSLGGGVALQIAIRHPDLVGRLVVISAPAKRNGWYPEDLAGMSAVNAEIAASWVGSPMHQAYASVAPRPDDWTRLAGKLGELLRKDYDWSEEVAAMKSPTLIAVGDADGVRLPHAVEMFGLRGGGKATAPLGAPPDSQLTILPGTTHFSILNRADLLLPSIVSFLDGRLAGPTPGMA